MIEKPEPSSWLRQGLQQLHLVSPREGDELIDTDEPSALLKLLYGIAVLFQLLPPAAALGFIAYATVNGCGELGLVGDEAQLALLGLADEMALPLSLSLYLALEALHYLWTSTCSLMEPAQRVESTTTEERLHTWRRCLADTTTSCEAMITGWFYRKDAGQADSAVRLEELTRGNVREWLAWALAIGKGEKLLEAEEAEVDVAMKMLEEALSRQQRRPFHFPDGHVATIASMRLNRDPPSCNVRPRPLFYYAITDLAINGLYTPHKMKAAGFKYYVAEGLSYWYHPGRPSGSGATSSSSSATAAGTSSDAAAGVQAMEDAPSVAEPSRVDPIHQHASASKPVVFVHGVGLGPLPYLGFIEQLLEGGGPLLVVELPFVAQRLSALGDRTAPHQESTVQAIETAMGRHDLTSATFVGHSLGTVYLSWVAQLKPHLLASAVFIDPIVFLLHQPKVAHSFLYSEPHDTLSAVEHYFIKSEHSIVHFFHHHFFWHKNVLWANDLKRVPTEVVLSSEDAIVPVEHVSRYLRKAKVASTVLKGARHGDFLSDVDKRTTVLGLVRRAQKRSERRPRLMRLRNAVLPLAGRGTNRNSLVGAS